MHLACLPARSQPCRFIANHNLPASYQQQIVEFVIANTGGSRAAHNTTTNVDPFTGETAAGHRHAVHSCSTCWPCLPVCTWTPCLTSAFHSGDRHAVLGADGVHLSRSHRWCRWWCICAWQWWASARLQDATHGSRRPIEWFRGIHSRQPQRQCQRYAMPGELADTNIQWLQWAPVAHCLPCHSPSWPAAVELGEALPAASG